MAGIFNGIREKVVRYVEVNINLFKIKLIGRTSNLMSYFMFALTCLIILCCIILFFGFGLTEVFMDAGMSHSASFFLTTGIYCALLLIVIFLRKNFTRFFANAFINILTEDDEDENDSEDNSNPKS
ncbi:MAG: hypothetical protein K9G49_06280 [Taibaiella sp.]|nr:hypothetical protein [Taibaiella sp.]